MHNLERVDKNPQIMRHENHFPMQNLLNMLLKTSSDMSSPLIVARASAASLKSIFQKSIGNCSLIDDSSRVKASRVLTSCSNCL
jgi:hypothetical protein